MVHLFTSQRLLLRSTLSHNSNESPNGNSSRTETEHLLFSLSLSACMLMFASVMTLHIHIFACRHSQFISLSLRQHHGGCCFLPDGEMRAMCLGSLVRNANAGELEAFSVVFFLWRIKARCQRAGGKMETVLSVGGSYEDPQEFAGPNLPHWSNLPIIWREEHRQWIKKNRLSI